MKYKLDKQSLHDVSNMKNEYKDLGDYALCKTKKRSHNEKICMFKICNQNYIRSNSLPEHLLAFFPRHYKKDDHKLSHSNK